MSTTLFDTQPAAALKAKLIIPLDQFASDADATAYADSVLKLVSGDDLQLVSYDASSYVGQAKPPFTPEQAVDEKLLDPNTLEDEDLKQLFEMQIDNVKAAARESHPFQPDETISNELVGIIDASEGFPAGTVRYYRVTDKGALSITYRHLTVSPNGELNINTIPIEPVTFSSEVTSTEEYIEKLAEGALNVGSMLAFGIGGPIGIGAAAGLSLLSTLLSVFLPKPKNNEVNLILQGVTDIVEAAVQDAEIREANGHIENASMTFNELYSSLKGSNIEIPKSITEADADPDVWRLYSNLLDLTSADSNFGAAVDELSSTTAPSKDGAVTFQMRSFALWLFAAHLKLLFYKTLLLMDALPQGKLEGFYLHSIVDEAKNFHAYGQNALTNMTNAIGERLAKITPLEYSQPDDDGVIWISFTDHETGKKHTVSPIQSGSCHKCHPYHPNPHYQQDYQDYRDEVNQEAEKKFFRTSADKLGKAVDDFKSTQEKYSKYLSN
ncbi:hypothetical protein PsAD13_01949 [Pseudovibrio sp. Ad13]|uniref:hypothetical protein n=1 Tax=Pseudovibrio sp. Ad13 TaxID=989396 RepID=UPI0007AE8B92|nr:hypothetical protein [Pseudovibrio sp. Ad13]KZK84485.1 hypothetical protein PsAD13_01949 [Pseudovibrio sp. Ad13]